MSRHSMCRRLLGISGLVGLLAVAPGARTGSAQSMNDMVRTLNNIVNPSDAKRFDDQARRRRNVTGTTIAPGSILPTGTAGGATTAIRVTKVFRAIAATEVTEVIIATGEIIGTIGADIQATLGTIRLPS